VHWDRSVLPPVARVAPPPLSHPICMRFPMRLIRLATLGAVLSLAAATPALAQGGGGGQRGARMLEMAFKGIELEAGQKAKVDSIVARYRAEMPQMMPGSPPDDATRARMREMRE